MYRRKIPINEINIEREFGNKISVKTKTTTITNKISTHFIATYILVENVLECVVFISE